MCRFGLIGEKLSHSFSPVIHKKLGVPEYGLFPMARDEVSVFLRQREFDGVNVTIPYKRDVISFLDCLDPRAEAIGSVNTIRNRNGRLIGYNTDYDGFLYTLRRNRIITEGRTVLILGTGGVSKTAQAVLKAEGAAEVLVASRTPSQTSISYADAISRRDVEIIVNATPVGMYPRGGETPLSLSHFERLIAAVDLIYNPLQTEFLRQAVELGATAANGLPMLVYQAKAAAEIFLDTAISDGLAEKIYKELFQDKANLILIGMPMSGKSTIGRMAAKVLGKRFVDIDEEIVKQEGRSIPEIFERFNEAGFRELERNMVKTLSAETGLVISTGGGTPLFPENIRNLRQNGVIAFLDRPLEKLAVGRGRPLAKSSQEIAALYDQRHPVYCACCDFTVKNDTDAETALGILIEQYNRSVRRLSEREKGVVEP